MSAKDGVLPFTIEVVEDDASLTAHAGLPIVLETMRALSLSDGLNRTLGIRRRNSGATDAQKVEALVLLMAAGGECVDDIEVLRADKGLMRLVGGLHPQTSPPAPSPRPGLLLAAGKLPRMPGRREGEQRRLLLCSPRSLPRPSCIDLAENHRPGQGEGGRGVRSAGRAVAATSPRSFTGRSTTWCWRTSTVTATSPPP